MMINESVYIAFAKHVVCLDRTTGAIKWNWKIPRGRSFPAILLDGEQLFVSAMGYTYCLDATTGRLIWENDLAGFGTGVACIATQNGQTNPSRAGAAAINQQRAAQSAAS